MDYSSIESIYQIYQEGNGRISTDTRKIKSGDIFWALKGENFDGNAYAEQAIEKGARFLVLDNPEFLIEGKSVLVKNGLESLQQLAHYHRKQLDTIIIGITGSNGKTTTKEITKAILSTRFKTFATEGNLNNHIGVPLSLLSISQDTQMAIIEMGANHVGEIEFLCNIADPDFGVITNIGNAHLEGFGGIEGVKRAKSELYKYIGKKGGIIFRNQNMDHLEKLSEGIETIVYGAGELTDDIFIGKLQKSIPQIEFEVLKMNAERMEITSHLYGEYNFQNIMTGFAIGRYFHIEDELLKDSIESFQAFKNRSQIVKHEGNTFYLEAYNANPSSMRAAIQSFVQYPAEKKILVLGDMLELGEYSMQEHSDIIDVVLKDDWEQVILVGSQFPKRKEEALVYFSSIEELRNWWKQQNIQEANILLKGSRGIGLEKLLD